MSWCKTLDLGLLIPILFAFSFVSAVNITLKPDLGLWILGFVPAVIACKLEGSD